VSKAHRRIKVRKEDWGYQACQLEPGKIWVNKVGTYGMGSAAYYWGRFAAAVIVRLCCYLMGKAAGLDVLLYVDDLLILAGDKAGIIFAGVLIYFLMALGVPFRWDKCRGGTQVEWIGYWADLWQGRLGISERRAQWLASWMTKQVDEGRTELADFASVLGRLCFAMGPLEFLRPFIAPLFAWAAAVGYRGSLALPWSVAFIFKFLASEFLGEGRVEQIRVKAKDLGIAFRADAKAEGQCVRLGGWECLGGTRPAQARWFAVDLDRKSAPWAFARGEPFRTIASLELFATLLCVVVFGDDWPAGASGEVVLQGVTDNLGNSFAVSKLMTSKFPLVVILAEVAAQLRARSMVLRLGWAPRDQNEEADALTNNDFSAFDLGRRVSVDLSSIDWRVLPRMLEVAQDIYDRVQKSKGAGAPPKTAAPFKPLSFRQRHPW
jgi:hypothetical protein